MFVQKPKELPYIAVFKLPSGEEFVCKVEQETDDSYLVMRPYTIGQTAKGLQFIPILVLADPEKIVSIPKTAIRAEVAPDVESQYESLTSGIALPKKSAIIV